MLAKLIIIIVAAGATACALLVNRQHRIDTAHEIAVIHQRLIEQEQSMWKLRGEVADRTRTDHIRRKVDALGGTWVAIPAQPRPTEPAAAQLALQAGEREPAVDSPG